MAAQSELIKARQQIKNLQEAASSWRTLSYDYAIAVEMRDLRIAELEKENELLREKLNLTD